MALQFTDTGKNQTDHTSNIKFMSELNLSLT